MASVYPQRMESGGHAGSALSIFEFRARSMPAETDAAPGFGVMGYTLQNRVVNGLLKMERARGAPARWET